MPARKPKPWRGFPNANVMHAIRARLTGPATAADPAKGEQGMLSGAANAIPIGTLPPGAFITAVYRNVETAFAGTTPVIALGTTAGGVDIVADVGVAATGRGTPTLVAGAGTNYRTADTVVYATLTGTGLGVGVADVIIEYYMNKD